MNLAHDFDRVAREFRLTDFVKGSGSQSFACVRLIVINRKYIFSTALLFYSLGSLAKVQLSLYI